MTNHETEILTHEQWIQAIGEYLVNHRNHPGGVYKYMDLTIDRKNNSLEVKLYKSERE